MTVERKIGDKFEEELGNGYVAVFEVVSINADKTINSKRIALNRAPQNATEVHTEVRAEEPKAEVVKEVKAEVKKEVKSPATTKKVVKKK